MDKLKSFDNVFYPPVGIAHITRDVSDLVRSSVKGKKLVEINCSSQPNSRPHLGTVTTLMTAFAMGWHLQKNFKLPVLLTFDQLENAPAEKMVKNGIEYQKSLMDCCVGEISFAEDNMKFFRWIFQELSKKTGVDYRVRSYKEFQENLFFRRNAIKILNNYNKFAPFLSPTEGAIRFRFPCPICKYSDKSAKTVKIEKAMPSEVILVSNCFTHGLHKAVIRECNKDFIDTNTPLRAVIKGGLLIEESFVNNSVVVMVDGDDWSGVWAMRVFSEGVTRLGYSFSDFPVRFFAPLITDWSGAKFSKSLYVKSSAYQYLPRGFLNFQDFLLEYGEAGFNKLWNEVRTWVENPKKLFRNYSVDYLRLVLSR